MSTKKYTSYVDVPLMITDDRRTSLTVDRFFVTYSIPIPILISLTNGQLVIPNMSLLIEEAAYFHSRKPNC